MKHFAKSTCTAAMPSRGEWRRWRRAQAGGAVVLDAAHPDTVSADRSQRGQPESSCGRRELDRSLEWAPSHSAQAGCFATAIMAVAGGRIDGWWNACSTETDSQRGLA